MSELTLIRHAQSLGNVDGSHADTDLSPLGLVQAEELRARLEGRKFDLVFASPLVRARRTARLALPDAELVIDERLRELEAQPVTHVLDVSKMSSEQLLAAARAPAEIRETGPEFVARVRTWLAALPRKGSIVAFTHFGVVRECIGLVTGQLAPQTIAHCSLHDLNLR